MAVLPLSSLADLSDWIGDPPDDRMRRSLESARDVISARVSSTITEDDIPTALHRACTMMAAAMHERSESVFGVDAFSIGGDTAVGFLTSDPTISMLLRPYLAPALGFASDSG